MNLRSICTTSGQAFKRRLPKIEHLVNFAIEQTDEADVLAHSLEILFNLSIQQCKIPEEWKKATVSPLYKGGSKCDRKNFRPISVIPIVSKVLERLVHNQFAPYFDENNLLCRSQSGFRKKHLTETAVTHFLPIKFS